MRVSAQKGVSLVSVFVQSRLIVKACVQVLHGVDCDFAAGLNALHDDFHCVFGDGNTAACVGLSVSEAVEEKRIAVLDFTLGVVAEIQDILVLILILRDVLAFLGIEIRNVFGGYKLVEVIFWIARPIVCIIDLGVFH